MDKKKNGWFFIFLWILGALSVHQYGNHSSLILGGIRRIQLRVYDGENIKINWLDLQNAVYGPLRRIFPATAVFIASHKAYN
jgi:hypothetical protein